MKRYVVLFYAEYGVTPTKVLVRDSYEEALSSAGELWDGWDELRYDPSREVPFYTVEEGCESLVNVERIGDKIYKVEHDEGPFIFIWEED
jgi:hypothetical protein